jgi:fatty-acyl-CoA synthase
VPRYVMFVDAFPMTITGKIQKFVLREQMAEVLDLKEEVTA